MASPPVPDPEHESLTCLGAEYLSGLKIKAS